MYYTVSRNVGLLSVIFLLHESRSDRVINWLYPLFSVSVFVSISCSCEASCKIELLIVVWERVVA